MALQHYRDRIVGQKTLPLEKLKPNRFNWRTHSELQASSLDALLENVGVVQTVVWNQRTGNIVDGHLRRELAERRGEKALKVTVVDLDEDEERVVLATFDPMGAMAGVDEATLRDLVAQINGYGDWATDLLHVATGAVGIDLEAAFAPGDERDQGQLDQTHKHVCPQCGHAF